MISAATRDGIVRTFNRFEAKFILREEAARELIAELAPYTTRDAHADPDQGYPVYSVYWDSPDLVFFWEKVDGQKFRRKLRFRRYEGSDQVFVEIKQRTDQTVQKRRTLWTLERAASVFSTAGLVAAGEYGIDDPIAQEALVLCRHHLLEPKLAVAYRRRAYFGRHENDLRITFDTRVQYCPRTLDVRERFETGKYLLPANLCVLEVKFNHTVPLWMLKLLQRHDLCARRFSKYCRAADLEFYGGRFTPDP